jgi:hypothetical protein
MDRKLSCNAVVSGKWPLAARSVGLTGDLELTCGPATEYASIDTASPRRDRSTAKRGMGRRISKMEVRKSAEKVPA